MRFIDSTVILIITQSVGLAVGFLISILVSRTLGADGKGVFSLLLSMATIFFGISNLGLGFASQYFASRRPDSLKHHLANILFFPQIVAVLVVALFLVTFPFWRDYIGGLDLLDLLPVFVMLLPVLVFEGCCHLLAASGQFRNRGIAILAQSGVTLAAAVVLLRMGQTAVTISYSYALGWLLGAAVAFYFVTKESGYPSAPSISLFRETFQYSIWIYLGNLIREVSLRVDFLTIYSLRSSTEAGIYSVAAALTSGLTLIVSAIQTSFFPSTSAKTDSDARDTTPFYYRQMILVMFAAGLMMAVVSHPMLLIFGQPFLDGRVPMLILLIGTGVKGINAILMLHLLGRGKAYVMTLVTTFTLVTSILLNLILVPRLGMTGAALATLLTFVSENIVLIVLYKLLTNGQIGALYTFTRADLKLFGSELGSLARRAVGVVRDYSGGAGNRE